MSIRHEVFSIGIEEEYLLIDPETRALAGRQPAGFMARCKEILGSRVTHEFLQSQVEIGTGVCRTVGEARAELLDLRQAVAASAEEFGMRMIAASTHPWSHWRDQEPVDMERYRILGAENRSLARRMAICGMHVHAGIEDLNLRVDLMNQVSYFMPHLLALSTSSPFWEGHDTGLKAFRPIIIGDLPRSGLPEVFESWNDWTELLDDLAATGRGHRSVEDLVGPPAELAPSNARDPDLRRLHLARRRPDDRGALSINLGLPAAPAQQQPALAPVPAHPDPRE